MRTKHPGTRVLVSGTVGVLFLAASIWFEITATISHLMGLPAASDVVDPDGLMANTTLNVVVTMVLLTVMATYILLIIAGVRKGRNTLDDQDPETATKRGALLACSITAVGMGVMTFAALMSITGNWNGVIAFLLWTPVVSAVSTLSFAAIGLIWLTVDGLFRLLAMAFPVNAPAHP